MDWPELLQGLAIAGLALQALFFSFRLNKVVELSIRQGEALAKAYYQLEKKVNEND